MKTVSKIIFLHVSMLVRACGRATTPLHLVVTSDLLTGLKTRSHMYLRSQSFCKAWNKGFERRFVVVFFPFPWHFLVHPSVYSINLSSIRFNQTPSIWRANKKEHNGRTAVLMYKARTINRVWLAELARLVAPCSSFVWEYCNESLDALWTW